MLAKLQPLRYHENIIVFSEGKSANGASIKATYYPQMTASKKIKKIGTNTQSKFLNNYNFDPEYADKEYTDFYPSTVLKISNPNKGLQHPTQIHPESSLIPPIVFLR